VEDKVGDYFQDDSEDFLSLNPQLELRYDPEGENPELNALMDAAVVSHPTLVKDYRTVAKHIGRKWMTYLKKNPRLRDLDQESLYEEYVKFFENALGKGSKKWSMDYDEDLGINIFVVKYKPKTMNPALGMTGAVPMQGSGIAMGGARGVSAWINAFRQFAKLSNVSYKKAMILMKGKMPALRKLKYNVKNLIIQMSKKTKKRS
jgi:hypothetical protein